MSETEKSVQIPHDESADQVVSPDTKPSGNAQDNPPPAAQPAASPAPPPAAQPSTAPASPVTSGDIPAPASVPPAPPAQNFFAPDGADMTEAGGTDEMADTDLPVPVTWTASEFVAHEKSVGWYGMLALVTVLIAGLIRLILRDTVTAVVVVVAAVVFGVYAARKPHQIQYKVDASGVGIGKRHYNYEAFRSFSIVPEGAFSSIIFMPLKRFAPMTSIYYAPEDEEKIVAWLEPRLPVHDYMHDPLERLMRNIRF